MPASLVELWTLFYQEVIWLHARWKIYRQLYTTSEIRVQLLNEAAPVLSSLLQNALGDEVQLGLSKLADPVTNGKNRNLTLETLLNEVEAADGRACAAELRDDLAAFRIMCKDITSRRNKYIAHYDRETVLRGQATAEPGASRKEIDEALQVVARFMNRIETRFRNSTTAYDHIISDSGDGEALASIIRSGLRYMQLVRNGSIPQNDIDSLA